ncbi:hypothetical protein JB92DRAFT_2884861 [Gautieria morchelliformis]|nr:hypothetical protein JB92DRAFT_2884861 [Gautieria morchelliformis]
MDIAELLKPAAESHMFEGTDEDIYQSVMDVKKAREENKDNSNVIDGDIPIEPASTRNEALQAVLVLSKYVRDIDDPFARKLEMMLGSFGQRTRAAGMKKIVLFGRCRTANPNPKSLRYPS